MTDVVALAAELLAIESPTRDEGRAEDVVARGLVSRGWNVVCMSPMYTTVDAHSGAGTLETPLEIPESAVVVPGARTVTRGWGAEQGLSLQAPVIVKYRDEGTDLSTALEGWLR